MCLPLDLSLKTFYQWNAKNINITGQHQFNSLEANLVLYLYSDSVTIYFKIKK